MTADKMRRATRFEERSPVGMIGDGSVMRGEGGGEKAA
jgi:hypothetical protein